MNDHLNRYKRLKYFYLHQTLDEAKLLEYYGEKFDQPSNQSEMHYAIPIQQYS